MNNMDNIDCNNVTTNRMDTMSFLGILSPAGSSIDSADAKMNQMALPMDADYILMENIVTDNEPYLKIIEEPVEKFRFRYKSEMAGTHGSLIGVNSDKIRKNTYPSVKLENYTGRAIIRCSLYQNLKDEPHAHRLVMKVDQEDQDDPHDIEVSPEKGYTAIFKNMGIIHTAKRYLASELSKKLYRLHLEKNGKSSQNEKKMIEDEAEEQSKAINLNTVRLKFEAYCEEFYEDHKYLRPLCRPIYSHGINNLKSALTGELKIVRLDLTTASCVGGQEIFILVEKVTKNNIKVRFYECDDDDNEIWEDYGRFSHNDVHHQYAIVFKAPPYKDLNIEEPVNVFMQLVRPSDGAKSLPIVFKYKPSEKIGRKRARYYESVSSGEIPATIPNFSFGSVSSLPDGILKSMDSDFFKNLDNLNSDEFNKLFESVGTEYNNLCTDGHTSTSTESRYVKENDLYSKICKKVIRDLTLLLKTNPSTDKVESLVKNLFNHFRAPDGNNAIHCAILNDESQHLRYMLLLLSKMKHLKILDLKNNKLQTALHVAVWVNDPTVVNLLLLVGADPNITDEKGNTPLHLAVKYNLNLTEYIKLVHVTDLQKESDDGQTPLYSAVQKGNLNSVKLLVNKNADVNHKTPSSGCTVLHLAIEEKNKEILKFLLEETNAKLDIENYSKITPIHLANLLSTEDKKSENIFNIISEYDNKRGFESLMIKEEPVYDSSSDESDINIEVKLEPNSTDVDLDENSLTILKNSHFTKDCITELGSILDGTDYLLKLSKDLHFDEIQKSLMTLSTNQLLNYTYVTGISVYNVRDLLKSYGANEAVAKIDQLYLK